MFNKIVWHEVTPLSRWTAIILFVGVLPIVCFSVGFQYGSFVQESNQQSQDILIPLFVVNQKSADTSSNTTPTDVGIPASSTQKYLKLAPHLLRDASSSIYTSDTEADTYTMHPNIDGTTFEVIANNVWEWRRTMGVTNTSYYRDKNHVYQYHNFEGEAVSHGAISILEGADPATFRVVANGYSVDASSVFHQLFNETKRTKIDPKSFEIYGGFAKDKKGIYNAEAKPLIGVDVGSFETHGDDYYGKDNSHVFSIYSVNYIEGADAKNFMSLGCGYGRDTQSVYFQGEKIPEADLATFNALAPQYSGDDVCRAQDKNYIYKDGNSN